MKADVDQIREHIRLAIDHGASPQEVLEALECVVLPMGMLALRRGLQAWAAETGLEMLEPKAADASAQQLTYKGITWTLDENQEWHASFIPDLKCALRISTTKNDEGYYIGTIQAVDTDLTAAGGVPKESTLRMVTRLTPDGFVRFDRGKSKYVTAESLHVAMDKVTSKVRRLRRASMVY